MPLPLPTLLQTLRSNLDAIAGKVVKHNDVGACLNSLVGLGLALHLNLDLHAETCDRLGSLDGIGDAAPAPDVVVLEHYHGAEVHAMRISTSNQHAVFLNETEPGGCLSRACDNTLVSGLAGDRHQPLTLRSDTGASRKCVQSNALAEEDTADGSLYSGDTMLAVAQVDGRGLVGMPLDGAAALSKDLVEEGSAGNDTSRFTPEGRDAGLVSDNEAGIVERGGILGEPGSDGSLPRGREEICEVSLRLGHFRGGNWGDGRKMEEEERLAMGG